MKTNKIAYLIYYSILKAISSVIDSLEESLYLTEFSEGSYEFLQEILEDPQLKSLLDVSSSIKLMRICFEKFLIFKSLNEKAYHYVDVANVKNMRISTCDLYSQFKEVYELLISGDMIDNDSRSFIKLFHSPHIQVSKCHSDIL